MVSENFIDREAELGNRGASDYLSSSQQSFHGRGMGWTDGRHLADLSVDKLHTVVRGEYPGLAHVCEFLDSEEVTAGVHYSHDGCHSGLVE